MTHQHAVWVTALRRAGIEQDGAEGEESAGQDVRAGDHLSTPDGVEEMPDGEWADEIPQGEEDEVVGGVGGGDVVDLREHQRVGEEDGVVEERLGDHQGGPEDGPPRVVDEQRSSQGHEADVVGRGDLDGLGLVDVTRGAAAVLGVLFDFVRRRFRPLLLGRA